MEVRGGPRAESRAFGIIPARGGSKGLPGKNLRPLGGVPLIGWTIKAAKGSKKLSRFIVSTDDPEIARVARELGAEVPFMRPAELARDESGMVEVLQHAVKWLEASGGRADVVCLMQPTSPFRGAAEIDAAVSLVAAGADSAQTVALDQTHPRHRFVLEGGRLKPMFEGMEKGGRRQDEPGVYRPTGAVYAMRRDLLMKEGKLAGPEHRAVIQEGEAALDIDNAWDFRLAELLAASRVP